MLAIRDLRKSYPGSPAPVLNGIDLDLARGETAALTGESGSGKSTLLHLVAGLDHPDSGSIRIDGTEIATLSEPARAAHRRDTVALIFQQFNLIPSLGVADNIAFQSRLNHRHDPAWQAELVAALGLAGLEHRYPEALSGGQQQRVAIARALAARPRLLLADEPTGNLDETTSASVMDLMLALVARSGTTLLMVTHSPSLAARMGRVFRLTEGKVSEART